MRLRPILVLVGAAVLAACGSGNSWRESWRFDSPIAPGVHFAMGSTDSDLAPVAFTPRVVRDSGESTPLRTVDDVRPFLRPIASADDAVLYVDLLENLGVDRGPLVNGRLVFSEEDRPCCGRFHRADMERWGLAEPLTTSSSGGAFTLVWPVALMLHETDPATGYEYTDAVVLAEETVSADGRHSMRTLRVLERGRSATEFFERVL